MIKTDYIHLDSINSVKTNNDTFDTTFTFNQKYQNIKKIYLKNAEIPIGFSNIRSSNNSNAFSFIANSITYNVAIATNVYTNISTLCTAINASISGAIPPSTLSIILSESSNNRIVITTTGTVTYSILPTTLSTILNISTVTNISTAIYSSQNIYNIAYDTYIQMCFYNIPSIFSSQGNVPSALKIPLSTRAYNILFYSNDRNEYDQSLTISDTNSIFYHK